MVGAERGQSIEVPSHAKIDEALKQAARERQVDLKELLDTIARYGVPELPSGETLRQKREAAGLSQTEAARRVGYAAYLSTVDLLC